MSQLLESDMYTMAQVAKLLQVSLKTVWTWTRNGSLASVRLGERLVRIRRSDLEAFMIRDQGEKQVHENKEAVYGR